MANTITYHQADIHAETLGEWIAWVEGAFEQAGIYFGHGTDNAWDEAVLLVCHVVPVTANSEPEVLETPVNAEAGKKILALVSQRVNERIPLPYLTHTAYFSGLKFYVDERVIIPRSPIAELIEQQFAPWIEAEQVERVLDLCTGSGCIAIATALAFPEVRVEAADICEAALAVAKRNVDDYQLGKQVKLVKSDLFASINGKYDVIVSNPPYVDENEMAVMPSEYGHEPEKALASGEDGLDCAREILANAADYLTDHGILIMEVGASQPALEAAFPKLPFTWLDFERGGEGVCLLTKTQLAEGK